MDRPLWTKALLSRELTASEYRLWSYLAWRQGGNSHAWPSQEVIASDLGLTVRAVRKLTRQLQDKGWLAVEWPDGPGRGHCRNYVVRCPEKRNNGSSIRDEKRGSNVPVSAEEKRNGGVQESGTPIPPNTIHRTLTETSSDKTNILFDDKSGRFAGITDDRMRNWAEAYHDVDVGVEIRRAEAWYVANPTRRKKNHARFLTNWLSRAEREQRYGNAEPQQYQRPQQRANFREQVSSIGERVEV